MVCHVLPAMRIEPLGGIFRRDGDSFFRPRKLRQTRRLSIPERFGLLGLRGFAVYRSENGIGVAPDRYADKRFLYTGEERSRNRTSRPFAPPLGSWSF